MAFKHGSKTTVLLDAIDLSSFLTDASFSASVDTADTTTFGSTWKTALAGTVAVKADFTGLYDPTSTKLALANTTDYALTTGVLTYAPAGALAIGDRARLMQVVTSSYAETSPVGGVVGIKWSAMGSAAAGWADVLHILTADTNTTTGATKDDSASSTTGWTAHLHVTAVSGGSWVVKLTDASASNFSDGADVTGGAFTAATGAAAQRLQGAAGATLRRYVRYVATRTGGVGGDTITFALAYSRNN